MLEVSSCLGRATPERFEQGRRIRVEFCACAAARRVFLQIRHVFFRVEKIGESERKAKNPKSKVGTKRRKEPQHGAPDRQRRPRDVRGIGRLACHHRCFVSDAGGHSQDVELTGASASST